jgi:hypothetical protein
MYERNGREMGVMGFGKKKTTTTTTTTKHF